MQVHGTNVTLHMFPSGAACANLTGDLNSVSIKFSKNNPENTTFGKSTAQRLSGIRDYTVDYAGFWNSASNESTVITELNASLYTLFLIAPASITGCPTYSGCGLINNLTITGPTDGPVAISFSLHSGTGSLTRGTAA